MLITLKQMKKLHDIQFEMFQELKRVLETLDIPYFFVHGSLLSAVTTHEFIAEDDDIDIAVFRDGYNRLMEKGNDIVSSKYCFQWSGNDDFPLSFAKFRKNGTEFCQPVLEKYQCHKGIYIDIFPIDYVPEKESVAFRAKKRLLEARINSRLNSPKSWKSRCVIAVSIFAHPSYHRAIKAREALYSSCCSSDYVAIFGGKKAERRMLRNWFGKGTTAFFCGMEVNCPVDHDAYLTRIYGPNYREKNPAEDRITEDRNIEVSASYIDFGNGEIIGQK